MAERIKSGIKKHRQSIKKRDRNTVIKSDLKTQLKKLESTLESNDITVAQKTLKETEAKLRKAASKGVLKKETASRKVSRIAKKVAALSS